jgi:hypothetical protein
MGLLPAWIQISLRILAVWSGSMLFAISFSTCYRVVSEQHEYWSDCADAQAGLDQCWSQTHYIGFVMTRHNYNLRMYIHVVFLLSRFGRSAYKQPARNTFQDESMDSGACVIFFFISFSLHRNLLYVHVYKSVIIIPTQCCSYKYVHVTVKETCPSINNVRKR